MMTRKEAYNLVDNERFKQGEVWPRDLEINPTRAQYKFNAPHILLLEEKLTRIRAIWYGQDHERLQDELVKMAAIAIRALEEVE